MIGNSAGIDYISKDQKILPEIEKLDKLTEEQKTLSEKQNEQNNSIEQKILNDKFSFVSQNQKLLDLYLQGQLFFGSVFVLCN